MPAFSSLIRRRQNSDVDLGIETAADEDRRWRRAEEAVGFFYDILPEFHSIPMLAVVDLHDMSTLFLAVARLGCFHRRDRFPMKLISIEP